MQSGARTFSEYKSSARAILAAVADPSPAAATFCAERGARHFDDVAGMLGSVRPDGLIIASPNSHHGANALAAIERGIPVLIEKPIAETVAAAQAIAGAAERSGVAVLVGHHRRHNPILQKVREIVQCGQLGRIATVTALATLLKPDDYFDVAWRCEPGGGPVLINAIHAVDDIRFLCGEIAAVQALTSNTIRGHLVEDSAIATLRFASGALGTLTLSDAAAAPWSWELTSGENAFYPPRLDQDCYLIAGTDGSLAVPSLRMWRYGGRRGWAEPLSRSHLQVEASDPLARQLDHYCDVIVGKAQPVSCAGDATRTLAATLAIHTAASTGRSVQLAV